MWRPLVLLAERERSVHLPLSRLAAGQRDVAQVENRKRVSLRVEDELIQAEQLRVVREEQVQVLQRLAQEEALHLVPGPGVEGVTDVVNGRVAAVGDLQERRCRVRAV